MERRYSEQGLSFKRKLTYSNFYCVIFQEGWLSLVGTPGECTESRSLLGHLGSSSHVELGFLVPTYVVRLVYLLQIDVVEFPSDPFETNGSYPKLVGQCHSGQSDVGYPDVRAAHDFVDLVASNSKQK